MIDKRGQHQHRLQVVAVKASSGALVWEPGGNRRVSVPRPGSRGASPSNSGDDLDLVLLGLLSGDDDNDVNIGGNDTLGVGGDGATLVETSGGSVMVKLTTTYAAAFGEYLKVWSSSVIVLPVLHVLAVLHVLPPPASTTTTTTTHSHHSGASLLHISCGTYMTHSF